MVKNCHNVLHYLVLCLSHQTFVTISNHLWFWVIFINTDLYAYMHNVFWQSEFHLRMYPSLSVFAKVWFSWQNYRQTVRLLISLGTGKLSSANKWSGFGFIPLGVMVCLKYVTWVYVVMFRKGNLSPTSFILPSNWLKCINCSLIALKNIRTSSKYTEANYILDSTPSSTCASTSEIYIASQKVLPWTCVVPHLF